MFAVVASVGMVFAEIIERVQIGDLYYNLDTETNQASVTYKSVTYTNSVYYYNEGWDITAVNIPETVQHDGVTFNVTSVESYAFDRCQDLSSATFPNSLKEIGRAAFRNCPKLKTVTFHGKISIGIDAFAYCNRLEAVYIYDLVAWCESDFYDYGDGTNPLMYAHNLYLNGELVRNLVIPAQVEKLGYFAFAGCENVESVSFQSADTKILNGAFQNCINLKDVTLPANITSLYEVFPGCTSLTIDIPNSVTELHDFQDVPNINYSGSASGAPWNAKSVNGYVEGNFVYNDESKTELRACLSVAEGEISVDDNVNTIKSKAFRKCYRVVSVTIPHDVTTIGDYAFEDIPNINYTGTANGSPWGARYLNGYVEGYLVYGSSAKKTIEACSAAVSGRVTIPQGVTHIYEKAFYRCSHMTSITLPSTVRVMGNSVFQGCTHLERIYAYPTTPPSRDDGTSGYAFPEGITVYVPVGSANTYQNAQYWTGLNYIEMDAYSSVQSVGTTSFSMELQHNFWELDNLSIASIGIEGGEQQAGNVLEYIGLEPNSEYNDVPVVLTSNTGETETINVSFTTTALELTTKASKPVSSTTAILLAETNMSDAEVNCGFEYKRNDAPDDMAGTKVFCPVASGQMAGRLKNLRDDTYYKYRAFYQSAAGNMYYGEWQYIFTGDATVAFEPVLYTYGATIVREDEATISGYALAGSEDFDEQGFEYWAESRVNEEANAPARMSSELGNHIFVQADGIALRATLTDLDAGTVYRYRVYGKVGDQYYYGTEQTFTTQGTYEEDAPEAIESVETTTAGSTSKFFHNGQILIRRGEKVYTLQGQEVRE